MTPKRVEREVRLWQELLGLKKWDVKVAFTADADEFANVVSEPDYYRATISFNLDKLKGKADLRKTVIHELFHVVLSPMSKAAGVLAGDGSPVLDMLEEQVCTAVEKMPLWRKV